MLASIIFLFIVFMNFLSRVDTDCRALDNQVYAAGVSVARDESASYVSWANYTLVSLM